MIGYYTYEEYYRRVEELMDKGLSRKDAKAIVDLEEKREYWDAQKTFDDLQWYEEQDARY